MEMVAQGFRSRLSVEERQALLEAYLGVGGGETKEVASVALGLQEG